MALLTTAVGLAVAMPTALLAWFESRMDGDRVLAQTALRTIVSPEGTARADAPLAAQVHASQANAPQAQAFLGQAFLAHA